MNSINPFKILNFIPRISLITISFIFCLSSINSVFALEVNTVQMIDTTSKESFEPNFSWFSWNPFFSNDNKNIYFVSRDSSSLLSYNISSKKITIVFENASLSKMNYLQMNWKEYALYQNSDSFYLQELKRASPVKIDINNSNSVKNVYSNWTSLILIEYSDKKIFLKDLKTNKERELVLDKEIWNILSLQLSRDSKSIYILTGDLISSTLYKLNILSKELLEVTKLSNCSDFRISKDSKKLFYWGTPLESIYSWDSYRIYSKDLNSSTNSVFAKLTPSKAKENEYLVESWFNLSNDESLWIYIQGIGFGDSYTSNLYLIRLKEEKDLNKEISVKFDKENYKKWEKVVITLKKLKYDVEDWYIYIKIPKEVNLTKIYGSWTKIKKNWEYYIKYNLKDILSK